MKVMISQPMFGKTEKQIKEERKYLVQELQEEGYEVIDTVISNFDCNISLIYYLAESIQFLDKADAVVFMKDWEKARGCVIEHEVAKRYGKFIKYL